MANAARFNAHPTHNNRQNMPTAALTDEATIATLLKNSRGFACLHHRGAKTGMIEPIYPAQRRKRGAERVAALETFREKEKLLGIRHRGLLEIRIGFQPELCRQHLSPQCKNKFERDDLGAGGIQRSARPNWLHSSSVMVKVCREMRGIVVLAKRFGWSSARNTACGIFKNPFFPLSRFESPALVRTRRF